MYDRPEEIEESEAVEQADDGRAMGSPRLVVLAWVQLDRSGASISSIWAGGVLGASLPRGGTCK